MNGFLTLSRVVSARRVLPRVAVLFAWAALTTGPAWGQADIQRNIDQGTKDATFGRSAIQSFNLDKPEKLDTSLPDSGLTEAAGRLGGRVGGAVELLKAGADARIQMFSIAQLGAEDLRNPFEIRVQVRVDVREIEVEVGGIVEGGDGRPATALLLIKPPVVVTRNEMKAREDLRNKQKGDAERPDTSRQAVGKKYLCSVNEQVEGFLVREIRRDALVVEMMGKPMEIPRGRPVIVCVPLSSLH